MTLDQQMAWLQGEISQMRTRREDWAARKVRALEAKIGES
jgi:hypothetical protein